MRRSMTLESLATIGGASEQIYGESRKALASSPRLAINTSQSQTSNQQAQGSGLASQLIGTKPSVWAVVLGVCVDASLSFALLAACHLAVKIGGLDVGIEAGIEAGLGAGKWSEWLPEPTRLSLEMNGPEALLAQLQPWIHLSLVAVCWMSALWMIQFFCVSAFRGTLGRALVGIAVNPVASRSRGLLGLPSVEVLTFGGILSLPFAILRTDKAVFVRGVRLRS
jgi:hypothetical protein